MHRANRNIAGYCLGMWHEFGATKAVAVAFDYRQHIAVRSNYIAHVGMPCVRLDGESQRHAVLRYLARFNSQRTSSMTTVMLKAETKAMTNARVWLSSKVFPPMNPSSAA